MMHLNIYVSPYFPSSPYIFKGPCSLNCCTKVSSADLTLLCAHIQIQTLQTLRSLTQIFSLDIFSCLQICRSNKYQERHIETGTPPLPPRTQFLIAGKTLLYLAPTDCPSSYETALPSLTFRSLKLKPHPVCHLTINHKLKGSTCSPVYMAVTVLCTRFRSKTAPHTLIQAKVSNLLRSVYDVCFVKDLGQTRKVLLILRRIFLAR